MEQEGKSAFEILGSPDDLKLRSCLTLFREAASGDFRLRFIRQSFGSILWRTRWRYAGSTTIENLTVDFLDTNSEVAQTSTAKLSLPRITLIGSCPFRANSSTQAAATSLIPALSCRSCRPNAPFAELVRLSRTSIADEMREEHRRRVLGEYPQLPLASSGSSVSALGRCAYKTLSID